MWRRRHTTALYKAPSPASPPLLIAIFSPRADSLSSLPKKGSFDMAVLPQLGGLAEAQMRALLGIGDSSGALLSAAAAAGNKGYLYNCAGVVSGAQSELTCNGGGGVVFPSRKRGREAEMMAEQYVSSSSALLPIPGMQKPLGDAKMMVASTSGRAVAPAAAAESSAADALVAELCRQGAEVDALVRAECDRMRATMEHARKRQRQELARAVAGAAARRLREAEAQLTAARRRAAELEERLRQAAAESQAWCGVARSHEAVAAGLRATLDHLLLRSGGVAGAAAAPVEGCGESDPAAAAVDDAQSCCFGAPADTAVATSSPAKWGCKACGEREATVLLLPCRHLCLCKSCEPRHDACPVCLAVKNASIHVAPN